LRMGYPLLSAIIRRSLMGNLMGRKPRFNANS
jgi:hypothetical protein